ncbi:KaiC domain-containing protein [Methanolacinia petrolearia]|uniref:KaiC domain-containing protein n=1 Tax=Methanolacinia petrolearia TaxID=54120 RepID=UPI003BAC9380
MKKNRVRMGIDGLDEMMDGGLIEGSICSIIGTYGTGKTTFALQFAYDGLKNNETVVYISLEEKKESIYEKIEDRGFELEKYRDLTLFVIKLDPTDFNLSINSIRNELPELIYEIGAKRVIVDPISLFEGLFNDESQRRLEMFRLVEILRDLKSTVLMTSEHNRNDAYASRYGLIEYLADTVVVLKYIRPDDLAEVHTAVEVVKMRSSNHSREIKPYEIEEDEINIYFEASVF